MKALIFAAGLGTRLKPLTDDRPKAMVEIAGKPMLQHVIERVAAAGFDDITINIHHFGQLIIDFLEKNDNFGLNIHISDGMTRWPPSWSRSARHNATSCLMRTTACAAGPTRRPASSSLTPRNCRAVSCGKWPLAACM